MHSYFFLVLKRAFPFTQSCVLRRSEKSYTATNEGLDLTGFHQQQLILTRKCLKMSHKVSVQGTKLNERLWFMDTIQEYPQPQDIVDMIVGRGYLMIRTNDQIAIPRCQFSNNLYSISSHVDFEVYFTVSLSSPITVTFRWRICVSDLRHLTHGTRYQGSLHSHVNSPDALFVARHAMSLTCLARHHVTYSRSSAVTKQQHALIMTP